MSDQSTLNAEVRLVEMTSRTTFQLDPETNEWQIVSSDKSVSEQFNEWANSRDMNPHGPCVITQNQFVESPTRLTTAYTLCAAVMTRKDQALLELSFREQTGRLLAAVSPPADAPSRPSAPPSAGATIPTAAGAVANAGAEQQFARPPVPLNTLGETSPQPPARLTLPSRPLPNPGVKQ